VTPSRASSTEISSGKTAFRAWPNPGRLLRVEGDLQQRGFGGHQLAARRNRDRQPANGPIVLGVGDDRIELIGETLVIESSKASPNATVPTGDPLRRLRVEDRLDDSSTLRFIKRKLIGPKQDLRLGDKDRVEHSGIDRGGPGRYLSELWDQPAVRIARGDE
jgi:hypothetical protein